MTLNHRALLLSYIRVQDHDAVVKAFTEDQGFQVFYLRGIYSAKNRKKAYLSPLNFVELKVEDRPKAGNLGLIREISPLQQGDTPTFVSSALLFFLADLLGNLLEKEPPSAQLFQITLETQKKILEGKATAHFYFLADYLVFMGLAPLVSEEEFLNPETGLFTNEKSYSLYSREISQLWKILLTEGSSAKIPAAHRRDLLESLMLYFRYHIPDFRMPRSLEVLYEVME